MAIDPEGRLYVSSRFEGSRVPRRLRTDARAVRQRSRCRVRARVRVRRHAVRRRSHRAPSSASIAARSRDGLGLAAAQRRGVSPGGRRRPRAVRHRADAVVARSDLPYGAGRHRHDARRGIRTATGSGVRRGRRPSRRRRRWLARAGCYRCRRRAPPNLSLAGPAPRGRWRSTRTARWSVCSNDTAYRLTPRPACARQAASRGRRPRFLAAGRCPLDCSAGRLRRPLRFCP